MQLFKRLLMYLFPEPHWDLQINPASFFVNFISPKQFFTVILRKIVENYRLYLYDVNFDPFEVKIGFWEVPWIKIFEVEKYFSYVCSADLNWYRFYNPANISLILSLVFAVETYDIFKDEDYRLYLNFLSTVWLLVYVYLSRIKIFLNKKNSFKKDYSKFVEIFFNFYKFVNEQSKLKIDDEKFGTIKQKLLKKIELFFFLFYTYRKLNSVFDMSDYGITDKEFFEWFFYDELKNSKYKTIINDFMKNLNQYSYSETFSTTEKALLNLVLPADFLNKYFFDWPDIFQIVENILMSIYDKEKIDKYLSSFLNDDSKLNEFFDYLLDYRIYKEKYFKWLKNYLFKSLNIQNTLKIEDIEDMISSFSPDMKIPESIKKESIITEKLINFYLTFVWWFWIGRSDTFYHRLFKKDLVYQFLSVLETQFSQDVLFFLGWLLYLYWKNVFYYQYAFESIRAWKQSFKLPLKANFKEIYSSPSLIHLLNETAVITLFEDINKKDIKLFIKNNDILEAFKIRFWKQISSLINIKSKKLFIKKIYWRLVKILDLENTIKDLDKYFDEEDIKTLKYNLYSLDWWIWQRILDFFEENLDYIKKQISNLTIMNIIAILKQTLFGLLIYITYLKNKETELFRSLKIESLVKIYLNDILVLPTKDGLGNLFEKFIFDLQKEFKQFFEYFIKLDDNKEVLKIILDNWLVFLDNTKSDDDISIYVRGEDLVWLRWFLRNITYYNKRYFIPV